MKRRYLVAGTVLLGLVLTGLTALWLAAPRPRINRESFDAIAIGMSETDVEDVLGVPAGNYRREHRPTFYGFDEDGRSQGKKLLDAGGKEWVGEECGLIVRFEQGRVAEKVFGVIPGGQNLVVRSGLFERIMPSWLRF